MAALVRGAEIQVSLDPEHPTTTIAGTDVTSAIREPRISSAVSEVATNLEVRADLIARQRAIIAAADPGIVAEGRDITTVVAPDAPVRVLLVADAHARVARRHSELGERVDAAAVTDQVIRRDRDDSSVATFHEAADGVVVVDSTDLSLDEVIDRISALATDLTRTSPGPHPRPHHRRPDPLTSPCVAPPTAGRGDYPGRGPSADPTWTR